MRGGRERWRQEQRRLLVYLPDAPLRQAAGDAAENQPEPVRQEGGVGPGDPEASPGAEDGAGRGSAQTAEKGRKQVVSLHFLGAAGCSTK